MDPWLRRAQHDLVKRAVWTARDLRDAGEAPRPDDLRALRAGLFELADEEGAPIDARALWARLCSEAPAAAQPRLSSVGAAIDAAMLAVERAAKDPSTMPAALAACLEIEAAFDALARSMNLRI